ncbi:YggS family pyridoxal phosphate-dependent enzyme [Shewanella sp. CG12_big_fil_rev_8_21_14_0_65_47_15]|uniref:YggS family pyridoxal phosphate-dependent enzyme n=1 Tax=Shewanella sp. CG12_big_fil_rev_8_21_14_0_65_47_15 TaxID=1975537 RepID=UPI000CC07DE1|nr:YggS family pyridoxal phosphate-dependent enzyme [Shewanella sp. CG12_big_fil_rev_8_21_14_0_65_47_15]PIW60871.1 MAG: YggS family pyridoxal phosphate-dependent enzyme [Shewanella sp. CG12_big_fil_rev_8_21_14_0_65_47_15]
MTTIADRLAIAQHRIAQAAQKCARLPNSIRLLAVSKTKPIEDIIAAYHAGQRYFGENYVQEGMAKIIELQGNYPDIEWHFIGPLQSNKTNIVAQYFDWMHTVSRDKIAIRLNEQRPISMAPLNICIQINISGEESKSGIDVEQMLPLAQLIAQLPNLTLRGLMAIPTATENSALQEQEFTKLKALFEELKHHYPDVDTLSMGMSNDLDTAIACGSTMVRIGSAIFGERDYSV